MTITLPALLFRLRTSAASLMLGAIASMLPFEASMVPTLSAAPNEVDKSVLDAQAARTGAIKKVQGAIATVFNRIEEGGGSGVIISPDGYALTNFHVVQGVSPFMHAGLADGVMYDAVLVGQDKVGDVALIKLVPKEKDAKFPFVELGDSDKVRIGDWSLAMGNPFMVAQDFTPTVTYGVISGTNRYQPPEGKGGLLEYTDCIQIETSINPGNSGGPLFNMQGELIGINGRGSFEKRARVNSGIGYAISVNQIKNFLGHLRAGLEADHATLGVAVATQSEDAPLTQMVVKQVLEESDAYRRGLREGDQLLKFAGRSITSTNQYKNILGIFPKQWRMPVTIRRANQQHEVLVRLMGNMAIEKDSDANLALQQPNPKAPAPAATKPSNSELAKLYEMRKGYANWYFNVLERDRLLALAKKHGDFSGLAGAWLAEGNYDMGGGRKGTMRFEIGESKDDGNPTVDLKLNVEQRLFPLTDKDLTLQREPIGSGGLMMSLYHYRRLLTMGSKGFEATFAHGGNEPFYPYPSDGTAPKSLAGLRVDCEVLRTKHGSVQCKWYFALKDSQLLGFETYLTKETDPCEVYFYDYKTVDGKELPHRIEVRYGDKRYAILTIDRYNLKKS